ncbi:trypsin-1 [Caerostris extrusa]|uniref:Vitamin K-dependent protein C n=1 Tax=Caerostris extrusa TaxID=172846 RepID=A0AAV4UD91_CAEEX|nr:trypsin-1 [Caerostris extrusa]
MEGNTETTLSSKSDRPGQIEVYGQENINMKKIVALSSNEAIPNYNKISTYLWSFHFKLSVGSDSSSLYSRRIFNRISGSGRFHEHYQKSHAIDSHALLRLTTPIEMENSEGMVNGACLPSKEMADNTTGTGTVSGWGTTSQGGSLSESLQAVDVPILSDDQCKEVYKDSYESTMMCAGYEEGGQDSCQGDSGGPFVHRSSDGVATLIGIVSWGYGCAQPKYPGVYTETAHFLDWIARTMKIGGGGINPQ